MSPSEQITTISAEQDFDDAVNSSPKPVQSDVPQETPTPAAQETTSTKTITLEQLYGMIVGNKLTPQEKSGYVHKELLKEFPGVIIDKDQKVPCLLPNQADHCAKLLQTLVNEFAVQDSSEMGTGKTFVMLMLAHLMKLPLIIICPPGPLINKWRKVASLFNVRVLFITSYNTLAGRKNKSLSHNLLVREDSIVEGKSITNFYPTQLFTELVRQGVLMIFDESQMTKNESAACTRACQVMANHLCYMARTGQTRSRMAVLSATPGNAPEHAMSLLKLLGIVTKAIYYRWNIGKGEFEWHGFQELLDFCRKYDEAKTNEILWRRPVDKAARAKMTILELYDEVVKNHIGSSMTLNLKTDYAAGFYKLEAEDNAVLKGALDELMAATGYDPRTGQVKMEAGALARLQAIYQRMENAKARLFVRLYLQIRAAIPTSKIIIWVNNKSTVELLKTALSKYKPLIMTGDVNKKTRAENQAKFQADSDEYNLMICTIGTGSTGLDYDDKYGTRERWSLMSCRWQFLTEIQSLGRAARSDSKSVHHARLIFGNGDNEYEVMILDALARKSACAKQLIVGDTMQFPGDYPKAYE